MKIWQTSTGLHPLVESFTVGQDHVYDQRLIPYDLQASAAHASMLHQMGVLTTEELEQAQQGLQEIEQLWQAGNFAIRQDQEDSHTAIEQYLTEHYGEVGKKIHTGRSRNDQSLVMIRLYLKEQLQQAQKLGQKLAQAFQQTWQQLDPESAQLFPGYTHTQRAMPTSLKSWLESYQVAVQDAVTLIPATQQLVDQNPLGSASGFGIRNFPLDREHTTKELGFHRTQENHLYCGFSRGYFESIVLQTLTPLMLISSRFASDLMLFTTQEFNFFHLPDDLVTGSSIMPQKKNYDLFEIMRGNIRLFLAQSSQIQQLIAGLGSGYHRDLQLTKPALLQALDLFQQTMELLIEVVPRLELQKEPVESAMTPDLFITEQVYERVKQGESFRSAYQAVKEEWFGQE